MKTLRGLLHRHGNFRELRFAHACIATIRKEKMQHTLLDTSGVSLSVIRLLLEKSGKEAEYSGTLNIGKLGLEQKL